MKTFRHATRIRVSASDLERWHHRPGALQRLTPPWERLRVVEEPPEIADGARTVIEVKTGPRWTTWVAEHHGCRPGIGFTDVQKKGPFAHWKHEHRFLSLDKKSSELVDEVLYQMPFGALGRLAGGPWAERKLERMFLYRHALTKMDLERWETEPVGDGQAKNVLITGATGMVGEALEAYLRMRGHRILRVTRHPKGPQDVAWDLEAGTMDLTEDLRIDAVVHLAGENIAGGRWSEARKRRILESRRVGTRLLCKTLAERDQRPEVLISASGVNHYATGTEAPQTETSPRGAGFLADVCEVWEGETVAAEQAGIRVVRLRFGIILSPAGGALAKMLPLFQLGLGGALGSGQQRMAWIALDDVIDIIHRSIRDPRYAGPVNVVAPESVTNECFTRVLAESVHRPAFARVPTSALELGLGKQMANETLLADLLVAPKKLDDLNYPFRFPELAGALAYLLP